VNKRKTRTEHGEELLRIEVLHSPLRLQAMRFGVNVQVVGGFRSKRVDDPQQTAAERLNNEHNSMLISISKLIEFDLLVATE
jgi:hypothetical protein